MKEFKALGLLNLTQDSLAFNEGGYTQNRGYEEYNNFFKIISLFKEGGEQLIKASEANHLMDSTDLDLVEEMIARSKDPKKVFRVLEKGPGEGVALETIKSKIKSKDRKSFISAIALKENPKFFERCKASKAAHKVAIERGETYLPEQQQDLILDIYGPLQYTLRELRKEVILKDAHCLTDTGMAFYISSDDESTFDSRINDQIKRALENEGFKVKVQIVMSRKHPKGVQKYSDIDPQRDRQKKLEIEYTTI